MREEIRTGHTGRSGWAVMCRRSAWLARGGPGEHGGMGKLLRPVSVIEEDGCPPVPQSRTVPAVEGDRTRPQGPV
ncbi:hypothetical protein EES37_34880 [Streptomyces sp. ADI91-18]|nr:hypothetical protein EES37_34880 [Streptomyces sp. ADI91-18]